MSGLLPKRQIFDNCQLWDILYHFLFYLNHNLSKSIWNLFSLIICSVFVNSRHNKTLKQTTVERNGMKIKLWLDTLVPVVCLEFICYKGIINSRLWICFRSGLCISHSPGTSGFPGPWSSDGQGRGTWSKSDHTSAFQVSPHISSINPFVKVSLMAKVYRGRGREHYLWDNDLIYHEI